MRIKRFRLQHIKSFANTGWVGLGSITLLVGANNSGKSTLLRGLGLLQEQSPPLGQTFLRSANARIRLEVELQDLSERFWPADSLMLSVADAGYGMLTIDYEPEIYNITMSVSTRATSASLVSNIEPRNYIYPYLSKRKVLSMNESVNLSAATAVSGDLTNLVAKIDRLSNPSHPDNAVYVEMCNAVLGFPVTTFPSTNGKRAGLITGRFSDSIGIDEMGEGVANLLGLIVDLCVAEQQLFLVEELENDLHPAALKALLELVVRQSTKNQFLISTHSNIVTRFLGAQEGAVIHRVEMRIVDGFPSSSVTQVENSPTQRIALLSDLGYELHDFDLWDGWLLLEESSAERIIRDFLIPWFAPGLSSVRTLAVGGVSKAQPTFADYERLFRFTHLEQVYHGRAWVILDGDEPGQQAVAQLRAKYSSWPAHHFGNWAEPAFEHYYPDRFKEQVDAALGGGRDQSRLAKKQLLLNVIDWIGLDEASARQEFEASASEIIAALVEIESELALKRG